jgi:hypothetical protein
MIRAKLAPATIAPVDRASGPRAGESGGPGGPKYMRALERANQVRLARAELKRGVAYGDIKVADVILAPGRRTIWRSPIC